MCKVWQPVQKVRHGGNGDLLAVGKVHSLQRGRPLGEGLNGDICNVGDLASEQQSAQRTFTNPMRRSLGRYVASATTLTSPSKEQSAVRISSWCTLTGKINIAQASASSSEAHDGVVRNASS